MEMEKQNVANEILAMYERLDVVTKKQVLDRMALSLRTKKAQVQKDSRDAALWLDSVYEALHSILRSGGSLGCSPAALKRLEAGLWPSCEAFMISSGLQKLTVVERTAAYKLLAQLLVKHADYVSKKSGAPLSAKLVVSCVGNLPGLFDAAYPGYIECGFAPVVIRGLLKTTTSLQKN